MLLLNTKPKEKNVGDIAYYVPSEKVKGTPTFFILESPLSTGLPIVFNH